MINNFFKILFFSFIVSSHASSEKVKCEYVDRVKCLCHAPILIKCGEVTGYIQSDDIPNGVVLNFTAKNKYYFSKNIVLYKDSNSKKIKGTLKDLLLKKRP